MHGTRDFHSFAPISDNSIIVRRYTMQEEGSIIEFDPLQDTNIHINDFVVTNANTEFRYGQIVEISAGEITVEYMTQVNKSNNLFVSWPPYPIQENVHQNNICFKIAPPKPTTRSGRSYKISLEDFQKINNHI